MGGMRGIAIVLLMLTASFAFVIESGDGGREFLSNMSAQKCAEENVQAVYECLGNVVRVVSSLSGEGSTFYKPDGRVIECPVVAPSDMGAECLQMMGPNYCPTEAECGNAPAPQIFPGQNDTAEQTGDDDYYIIEGEAASAPANITVQEPDPLPPEPPMKKTVTGAEDGEFEAGVATTGNFDAPLGYLVYVVLLLGVGAVGVLFMLFKNSLAEEEA